MSLSVTVLGSSGSYASTENPCTGYLLRSADAAVLLDCGPGTLGPLQREIDPADLTAVVLTHCHPDHWLELPVLRNVLTWFSPRDGLPVYGTAVTREMDHDVTVPAEDRADPLRWTTIDSTSEIEVGDLRLRFALTDHPVETLAVRVDNCDATFAFSSDTGPTWSFDSLGAGIDLAFCDASHLSTEENRGIPHMSAREAGALGRAADVGRLVVTHLVPGSDPDAHRAEASEAYGGPVDVALPGLDFDV
mgnify:CR=1 FL=1